jgi:DNA-binding transcriptional LysR family regulator
MAINIPTNLLRSFVAVNDAGSTVAAAKQVFVTQGALSLQLRRLEEMLGQSLFVRDGRKLTLNPAGETMLGYARRVLAIHDDAIAALAGDKFTGPVRIGMVQDFAESLLPGVLARFARSHGDAQLSVRVAGTAELRDLVSRGTLDLAIGFSDPGAPNTIRDAPTWWYGHADVVYRDPLPLVVLERPCRFRDAAISALDAAGRAYRIAVETPNLSTLRSAVQAGLGVSCRTPLFLQDVPVLEIGLLPNLASVGALVIEASHENGVLRQLRDVIIEAILDRC